MPNLIAPSWSNVRVCSFHDKKLRAEALNAGQVEGVVLLGDLHQPIGIGKRQRPQQDGMHDAENRRRRADADASASGRLCR